MTNKKEEHNVIKERRRNTNQNRQIDVGSHIENSEIEAKGTKEN